MPRGTKLDRRLLSACREVSIFRVEKYLKRGANVNFKCKTFGRTPIMTVFYSIRNDEEERQRRGFDIMKLLLDNGADPDIADKAGNILLIEVIKTFQVPTDFVELLLDAGADVHMADSYNSLGITPRSVGLRSAMLCLQNYHTILRENLMDLHRRQFYRFRRSIGVYSLPGLFKFSQEVYLLLASQYTWTATDVKYIKEWKRGLCDLDFRIYKRARELKLQLTRLERYLPERYWPRFDYDESSIYTPLTQYERRYMWCEAYEKIGQRLRYDFFEPLINPEPLVSLCLVEVSMCVGFESDRNERISQTGLCPSLQRRLMFTKS